MGKSRERERERDDDCFGPLGQRRWSRGALIPGVRPKAGPITGRSAFLICQEVLPRAASQSSIAARGKHGHLPEVDGLVVTNAEDSMAGMFRSKIVVAVEQSGERAPAFHAFQAAVC